MMGKRRRAKVQATRLELEGVPYVVLRAAVFDQLCRKAKVTASLSGGAEASLPAALADDAPSMAEKLIQRRKAAGLSQAELARRAGVRCETLNRIERGKTTPDFATVRKLVVAINQAELDAADLR